MKEGSPGTKTETVCVKKSADGFLPTGPQAGPHDHLVVCAFSPEPKGTALALIRLILKTAQGTEPLNPICKRQNTLYDLPKVSS